ncbi:hypothetical protein B484DRAFT_455753, partial [Ochromonadaceae sp. CCMP2298]
MPVQSEIEWCEIETETHNGREHNGREREMAKKLPLLLRDDATSSALFESYLENEELLTVLNRPMSLMERQGIVVFPVGAVLYIVLQLGMIHINHSTEFAICSQPMEQSVWFQWFVLSCSVVLATNAIFQLLRIAKESLVGKPVHHSLVRVFTCIFLVTAMCCTSQLMTRYNNARICKDAFGVYSAEAQWAEWIVSVPLLAYAACAVVNTVSLTAADLRIIGYTFLIILGGFLPIVLQWDAPAGVEGAGGADAGVGGEAGEGWYERYGWAARMAPPAACVSLSFSLLFCISSMVGEQSQLCAADIRIMKSLAKYILEKQQIRKTELLHALLGVYIYSGGVYLLGLVGLITGEQTMALHVVGSMLGKLVFVDRLADTYIDLNGDITVLLAAQFHSMQSQTQLLRFLFHEVRVPLNSLVIGLDSLTGPDLNATPPPSPISARSARMREERTIGHLRSSSATISNVLNKVLLLHHLRLEQVRLDLCSQVSLGALVRQVLENTRAVQGDKEIQLSLTLAPYLPLELKVDRERVEFALTNLLDEAISEISRGGSVSVTVGVERKIVGEDKTEPDLSPLGSASRLAMVAADLLLSGLSGQLYTKALWQPPVPAPTRQNMVTFTVESGDFLRSAQELEMHFEPFPPSVVGNGMGLACARALMRLHGGDVVCEMGLGIGGMGSMGHRGYKVRLVASCPVGVDWSAFVASVDGVRSGHRGRAQSEANPTRPSYPRTRSLSPPPPPRVHATRRGLKRDWGPYDIHDSPMNPTPPWLVRAQTRELPAAPVPVRDKKLRILVVDDAPSNAKMLKMMVQGRGHRAVCRENGLLAVQAVYPDADLSEHTSGKHTLGLQTLSLGLGLGLTQMQTEEEEPFDIILMDNTMPIM